MLDLVLSERFSECARRVGLRARSVRVDGKGIEPASKLGARARQVTQIEQSEGKRYTGAQAVDRLTLSLFEALFGQGKRRMRVASTPALLSQGHEIRAPVSGLGHPSPLQRTPPHHDRL